MSGTVIAKKAVLRRAAHIEAGEGRRIGIMFIYAAAAMGGVLTVGLVVAESLFMSQLPPSGTPFVFIIPAVSEVLLLLVYSRLAARVRFDRLVIASMIAFLLVGLFFRFLLATPIGASFGTLVALFVYIDAAFTLALGQFWTTAAQIFNAREARRLSGLIAAGGRVSTVVAGLSLTALLQRVGVANLLFIVIGSLGVCAACARALGRGGAAGAAPPPEAERSSVRRDLRAIWRAPLLRAILALALLTSLLLNTGQYQFLLALQQGYAGRSQALAGFLSRFEILAGLAALAMQIAITPRVMSRWGVVAGLAIFPLGIAFGAAVALLTGGALWAVALTVATFPVLLRTINDAGMNVLYLPIPAALRQRAKPLMDMLGAVCFGLAGVVFLLMQRAPSWTYVHWSLPILGLAGLWVALLPRVRRRYVGGLAASVGRRRLDADAAAFDLGDDTTARVLLTALHSAEDPLVAHALTLLAASPARAWDTHVATLLAHRSPEIRIMAVRYLGRPGNAAYVEPVAALLDGEDDHVRAAAIGAVCAMAGPMSNDRIVPFLDAPGPRARAAALVGLLTSQSAEARARAVGRLDMLLTADDPSARQEAARVLVALGSPQTSDLASPDTASPGGATAQLPCAAWLAPLLNDADRAVRLSAIQAVGALRLRALLPRLLPYLCEAAAGEALVRFGEDALPALRAALRAAGRDRAARARIPAILQRIGTPAAGTILLDQLDETDDLVRSAVYRALARLRAGGAIASPGDPVLRARVTIELQGAYAIAAARADLGAGGAAPPLDAILREREEQALGRVLALLALWLPDRRIERVDHALAAGTPDTRAAAIELLDMVVERPIGELLIPLVEAQEERVVQVARRRLAFHANPPVERLRALALTADPWLRAAAIVRIGTLPAPSLVDVALAALDAEDAVVRGAALATCRRLLEPERFAAVAQAEAGRVDGLSRAERGRAQVVVDSTTGRVPMLSTIERVLFLKVADIFSAVASEDLVPVAVSAREMRFAAGQTFVRQGDLDNCLYAIVDGDVGVVAHGVGQVAVCRPGSVVGEMALLSGLPRTADCVALTEVTALRVDRDDFWELLAEQPPLALGVITMLTRRLGETLRDLPQSGTL